jgi:predicted nucleic acid-binding protein
MIDLADLGLQKGDLVLLDSTSLVYLLEGGTGEVAGKRRHATVRDFVDAARGGGIDLVASTLAWTEVLRGPLARGDAAQAAAARRLLSDSATIRLEAPDVAVAEEAAALISPGGGAGGSPGLADAVHLATAMVLGAAAVLTNDGAWRAVLERAVPAMGRGGTKGRGLPRVLLVDELAFGLAR